MTISDQIIENGPYTAGDVIPGVLHFPQAAEFNALRDELIELRRLRAAAEALSLYEIDLNRYVDPVELTLYHGCRHWSVTLTDSFTLAELVRRADQHGEKCR